MLDWIGFKRIYVQKSGDFDMLKESFTMRGQSRYSDDIGI